MATKPIAAATAGCVLAHAREGNDCHQAHSYGNQGRAARGVMRATASFVSCGRRNKRAPRQFRTLKLRVFRHAKLVAQSLEQPQQCQVSGVSGLRAHFLLAISNFWVTMDDAKVCGVQ